MFKLFIKPLSTTNALPSSCVKRLILIALLTIFSNTALAEQSPGFTANVDLEIRQDSNIRRTESHFEQSDTIAELTPKLGWLGLFGKHQVDLSYQGDYGRYSDDDTLNYDHHSLKVHGLFDHSRRFNTEIEAGLTEDHDDPGSTNATSLLDGEFSQSQKDYLQGKLYYGTSKSIGQVVLQSTYTKQRYTDTQQSFRDYDSRETSGTFFYRIAPKTRLFLEGVITDYDYQLNTQVSSDQSNNDTRYLFGAEWDSTAKTTGIFKIGHSKKEYSSSNFDDISGLTLSLDMVWKPNTFTQLTIGAARDTKESAQILTSGYVSESVHAQLQHLFTPRTTFSAKIGFSNDDFANTISRNDRHRNFSIGLKHAFRQWLNVGINFHIEDRDSSLNSNDYRANIVALIISTKFD